jgi:hypothetical protein
MPVIFNPHHIFFGETKLYIFVYSQSAEAGELWHD